MAFSLVTPQTDLAAFTDHLSEAWGVLTNASAAQYISWSESTRVFSLMSRRGCVSFETLCTETDLTENGVDALIPILVALGIVQKNSRGYCLTKMGEEYFLPESPYYIGAGLFIRCDRPVPTAYLRDSSSGASERPSIPPAPDPSLILKIQLSRNLAPGVCAARTGQFDDISYLVDIGGGAGSLAIPFALDHPRARVTLVDLPQKLEDIRLIVSSYDLNDRIDLRPMDIFSDPWNFPGCDGMLFGNIFHVFHDARCRFLARQCFDSLTAGKVFVHEVLFNEDKSGPLIAALWNANMHVIGGRQRTAAELLAILQEAGFSNFHIEPTMGRFSLITSTKP